MIIKGKMSVRVVSSLLSHANSLSDSAAKKDQAYDEDLAYE